MKEFKEAYDEIIASKDYKTFAKKQPTYYLAHGFIQLDENFKPSTDWQIGFYSKEQDNLAVFTTNPPTLKGIEEAFKDGGVIDQLTLSTIPATEAIRNVQTILKENYENEQATSSIVIVQSIDKQAIYNITVITKTFSMIICKINATNAQIIEHKKQSILDLKKDEK